MGVNSLFVTTEEKEGAILIRMNRQEKLNALNLQMRTELIDALERSNRSEVPAVILTGEGRAFCVGADVREMAQDIAEDLRKTFHKIVKLIRYSDKIYIAAVNGITAGACISFALVSDYVLIKRGTKFSTAFQKLGLAPDSGAAYILYKLGGPKFTKYVLEGGEISDEELERGGLGKVVDDPVSEALALAKRISSGPARAFIAAKRMINQTAFRDFEEFLEYEALLQDYLSRTEDFKEGLRAFLEKREPVFKGR
ncbi:enoyl-CoA hydratase [Sulfolobales archaeon HS-7]|nr:enoyl-CoA hydratase [Sulfolobales archaeon HS-7]